MEELQTTLTALTGAVNRLLEQAKIVDNRLNRIEQTNDLTALKERLDRIERLRQSDSVEAEEDVVALQVPRTEEDLRTISRLPDSVKELRTFDGNPLQYVSWVHSVEAVLKDFEIVKNKPIYRSIIQSIRQKVIGEADAALVSYNIFDSDWKDMKKILSLHYADKRDVQTLEHQLNQLSQGSSKLDEFYSTINHQLSLIINKLKTGSYSEETVNALIETHRNRALDIFIRGLNPELSRMVIIQRPKNLPEAYSACLELQNLTMRNNILHPKIPLKTPVHASVQQVVTIPPRPPKPHFNSNFKNNWQNRNNRFRHNNFDTGYQSGPNTRNFNVKSEPMEVDRTIQTRRMDYMNRPRPADKRSATEIYRKDKQPRLFHIDTEYNLDEISPYGDEATTQYTTSGQNFMEEGHQAYLT